MRAYEIKVSATSRILGYGGSQAHAREVRDAVLTRSGGELRKKDLVITEVDLPTKKDELLGFVNGLLEA